MTDIAARAQLHRRRIRDAVAAYDAEPTAANFDALKHALHQAEARLVEHFDLDPLDPERDPGEGEPGTESGGTDKPPVDPNDDGIDP